ncbi:MAG: PQQ-binding-like beta-propeller repeat protein, partial [Polyangiales bacterium]
MNRCGPVAIALVAVLATAADARTIAVRVFEDTDGNGKRGSEEPGVANAVVAVEASLFAPTDAHGELSIEAETGIAWVRVPDGFVPGPVWARLDGVDHVDLPLRRLAVRPTGPLTFIATSDSHASFVQYFWRDLGDAALAAAERSPAPAFFTILGDVTQNTFPAQFDYVDAMLRDIGVPFVPVPGNHDWYDGGKAWREHYGPDNYSFDLGGVHFIVWNMALRDLDAAKFFAADMRQVAPEMTVVAMTHGPPSPILVEQLRTLGVDYVLSGHTHTNRVIDHGGMLEINTEPLLMGGLDFTPGGYRVITIDHGALSSEHRTTIDHPRISLVAPARGQCVPPGGGPLIVATEIDASEATVTARVDCSTPLRLAFAGGWSWRTTLPALTPGPHSVALDGVTAAGAHVAHTVSFDVCAPETGSLAGAEWPQLGGNAAHTGALREELAPPLVARWTTSVGGHVMHGAPAIAHGMIYVTTTDLANGDGGGVVALDLETGALRWRAPSAMPIRGAATVSGDVVSAVQIDCTVLAFDAQTGAARWRYENGLGLAPKGAATYGSIVADAGDLIIGNQRHLATIDAASGRPLWVRDPVRSASEFPSLASVAVGEGVAVGVFDRELGGVLAWDRLGADLLWQLTGDVANSINASPVIANGLVYLSNGATEVIALDLATGVQRWKAKIDPTGYDWAIATVGTPAIANGVIVVPTLWRELAGLDATSGRILWRFGAAAGSELRATHYAGSNERGFAASPVITGDLVWAVDTSGQLAALDLHTGAVLWRMDLELPVLAGIATTGNSLVIASYDGTVRALAPTAHERPPITLAACDAPPTTGCCDARTSPGGGALLAIAGYAWARRRRRRRSTVRSAS